MSNKINFIEKMKSMEDVVIPAAFSSRSGTPSISIVYSKNGKRLTLSKALASRLNIEKEAFLFPIVEDGVLLVAKTMPGGKGIQIKLNGEDKKICYNAHAVEFIVKEFELDYAGITSKAFTNVTFESDGDTVYAVIKLSQKLDS